MKNITLIIFLIVCLNLYGCTNLRQAIGTEKIRLDEFSIIEKNALIMPPKFDLQSELSLTNIPESKAKNQISILFGVKRRIQMDEIDNEIAKNFPFDQIIDNIREIIDEETYNLQIKSRAGIDMLFGDNKPPRIGPLLDPLKEQERVKNLLLN